MQFNSILSSWIPLEHSKYQDWILIGLFIFSFLFPFVRHHKKIKIRFFTYLIVQYKKNTLNTPDTLQHLFIFLLLTP